MASILDAQFGVVDEVTYGTPVTVARFFEFDSEGVSAKYGRVESEALRPGQRAPRADRFTPYKLGADGDAVIPVLSKGFGFWLKHMLGAVATTGPAETSVYTHTGTVADLAGKSYTAQIGRPLHPTGTVQPFTYHGGKVTSWALNNSVDGNLLATLTHDFEDEDTTTGLAVASYPTAMEPMSWVKGAITIDGTQVDVTEVGIECDNALKTDRRYVRGSDLKKEPVEAGMRDLSVSLSMDFDSLAQRNRVAAATAAGAVASFTATWEAPTLLGATIYPSLAVMIPALRLDEFTANIGGTDPLTQSVSGKGMFDGTNSPVTIVYRSADTTP